LHDALISGATAAKQPPVAPALAGHPLGGDERLGRLAERDKERT
jgi:hypothetical protein